MPAFRNTLSVPSSYEVKCSWVKCSEVLQCSDGPSNKVSNVIRKYTDNMNLLLVRILLLSYSLCSVFYQFIPVYLCKLCIFIVISMYSYCMFMYLHRANCHSSATLTEVFPCFSLSCKANARVKLAKMGHGPHSSKFFLLFYILFCFMLFLFSFVCKCVLYYCHRVATQLQLSNISHIIPTRL